MILWLMSERGGQDILWEGMIKTRPIDKTVANLEKEPYIALGGNLSTCMEDTHKVVN